MNVAQRRGMPGSAAKSAQPSQKQAKARARVLAALLPLALSACGGGSGGDPTATMPSAQAPIVGLPTGDGHGWKTNWGSGQKSSIVYDSGTGKPISEVHWSVSQVFQALLAEESPTTLIIDEGPNKGTPTNLRWKGTTIPYDNRYHPLTAAVCQTITGGWAGFGNPGTYAVYEDENGEGRIHADHFAARIGTNVVSSHSVPGVTAPTACGASPVWYTSYYDRGGVGPGTVAY